jgi:hypothetical protein
VLQLYRGNWWRPFHSLVESMSQGADTNAGSSTFVVNFSSLLRSSICKYSDVREVVKLELPHVRKCMGSSCRTRLPQSACGLSGIRWQASVTCPQQGFFMTPLPGVQFGTIFTVPRLQPARADFRGGHFTGARASVVQRGMTLMQLAQAVNNTPAVIAGNHVPVARIETRGKCVLLFRRLHHISTPC